MILFFGLQNYSESRRLPRVLSGSIVVRLLARSARQGRRWRSGGGCLGCLPHEGVSVGRIRNEGFVSAVVVINHNACDSFAFSGCECDGVIVRVGSGR